MTSANSETLQKVPNECWILIDVLRCFHVNKFSGNFEERWAGSRWSEVPSKPDLPRFGLLNRDTDVV